MVSDPNVITTIHTVKNAVKEIISHFFCRKEQHIEIVAIKAAANFQKLFMEGVKMAPEIVEECLKQGEVINQRVQEFEKANSVPLQDNGAEA